MKTVKVLLCAVYSYKNFPVRIFHGMFKDKENVSVDTIFFKNTKTNVYNVPSDKEYNLFKKLVEDINPDVVGFSVLSPYVPVVHKLSSIVKECDSNCVVLVGGIHPTISPDDCLDFADYVCSGEGEEDEITKLEKQYAAAVDARNVQMQIALKNKIHNLRQKAKAAA